MFILISSISYFHSLSLWCLHEFNTHRNEFVKDGHRMPRTTFPFLNAAYVLLANGIDVWCSRCAVDRFKCSVESRHCCGWWICILSTSRFWWLWHNLSLSPFCDPPFCVTRSELETPLKRSSVLLALTFVISLSVSAGLSLFSTKFNDKSVGFGL